MKDPRKSGLTRSNTVPPPSIEKLRAAAAARVGGRQHADPARAHLFAHIEALAAGRASVSPAAARMGKRESRHLPREAILPVLPD
jgi:enoyl-CoA hydratase/carnithine racemase